MPIFYNDLNNPEVKKMITFDEIFHYIEEVIYIIA